MIAGGANIWPDEIRRLMVELGIRYPDTLYCIVLCFSNITSLPHYTALSNYDVLCRRDVIAIRR